MHMRINEEKEFKEAKRSKKAIKKLKKEGKVQSICGFLVVKEDVDDDWIKSKKERFVQNRSIHRSNVQTCKALTKARSSSSLAMSLNAANGQDNCNTDNKKPSTELQAVFETESI